MIARMMYILTGDENYESNMKALGAIHLVEQKKRQSKGGNSKKKPDLNDYRKRERERKRKANERSLKRANSVQTPNVPLLTYSQWELFETLTNGKSLSYLNSSI